MSTAMLDEPMQTLEICKEVEIAAPIELVFEALLAELGPQSQTPDDKPMPMVLEPWPGGRWFRDLGNNAGHFWGNVQVIKPPMLLEISGPMFMSLPALNHLQYRLIPEGDHTRLKLSHRAIGQIPQDFRDGVQKGWQYKIDRISEIVRQLQKKERQNKSR